MNDLLRTKFFILLADTSQEVINTEMQDAYEDFCEANSNNLAIRKTILMSSGCLISPVLR